MGRGGEKERNILFDFTKQGEIRSKV